jgi:XRE family aerobic/anaerobic benzoate catabolism transcriptional regulator
MTQAPQRAEVRETLRQRLGATLQKRRLAKGITQAQLAELADLSLKYVGEIERGEANSTLEALERLAVAINWNPVEALEEVREPLTEGVRQLVEMELRTAVMRLEEMLKWLAAIAPSVNPARSVIHTATQMLPLTSTRLRRTKSQPSAGEDQQ